MTVARNYMNEIASENKNLRFEGAIDPDARLILLESKGESSGYNMIDDLLENNWNVIHDRNRGLLTAWIADDRKEFTDFVARASHVAYGVPDEDDDIEVYLCDPNRRDSVAPDGSSLSWRISCSKVKNERFRLEVA